MSIADVTENAILNLVYRAVAWANYADDASSSPETTIAVALHTADPTDSGNMSSSEATYTSYARASVNRDTGGWSAASGGSVSPAADIDFPTGTGGSETLTYFSTGKSGGGSAAILWSGGISPGISAGSGALPRLTTSTTITLA